MTQQLSPAAQAVLDACGTPTVDSPFRLVSRGFAAAALRAVANQLGYDNYHVDGDHGLAVVNVRDILAVADELESQ